MATENNDTSGQPSPELIENVQNLLAHVELVDVRPVAMTATLEDGVPPGSHVAEVDLEVALSFAVEAGVYGSRFDYKFVLKGADGDSLSGIEFSLVLNYHVAEDFQSDHDAAEYFTGTTGYFAAYPYARELFQSLASRLQVDPVVLTLLRRGTMPPGSSTIATAGGVEP